jgi:D-3-phosphoglycerate dehydrogenase
VTTVCEHAIAQMLALKKQLLVWTPEFMRRGGWRGTVFSSSVLGATVGIVGFGRIGRGVAERLAGSGVQILACDPFVKRAMSGVTLTDLPTLVASSDIVTLYATPSVENRHLINGQALAR